jgi:excisionase family DNA binding protein
MPQTLSPREFAEAIGASESSVKRWVDSGDITAARTSGGHRRIPRSEAVRYIREAGLDVLRPERLGLVELLSPADRQGGAASLYEALRRGERARAIGLIESAFVAGRPVAWVFDHLLHESLADIGTLWEHGKEGIFIEHRAIDICLHAIARLRDLLPEIPADAPRAIGAAPSGDPYLLPSQMVAAVLHEGGWQAINLGPDTPLDVLARGAEAHDARLVWLSCSSEAAAGNLARNIPAFADELACKGRQLMAGGRAWPELPRKARPSLVHMDTLTELEAYARGLRDAATAQQN